VPADVILQVTGAAVRVLEQAQVRTVGPAVDLRTREREEPLAAILERPLQRLLGLRDRRSHP
jgi:hypothetical protein